MGFLDGFFFGLGVLMALVIVTLIGALLAQSKRDSTDPPGGRSNLDLLIDYQTGCHYLSTHKGGLTPRLDADGKHICTKGKEGGNE